MSPRTLLEREVELARIERALESARDGSGTLVLVEGPAGIGKTTVLRAARADATDAGMRVLRSRGAELERDFAFGVVRQLFEPALAEATPEQRAELLQGPAALAGDLLGLPGAAPPVGEAHGSDPLFAMLHGLYWLVAGLVSERPLVLLVDDAHWADSSSLRFLAFLAPRLEELPLAVVVAARPGEGGDAAELIARLAMDPGAEVVKPPPLTRDAVEQLLAEGLDADPDPVFVAACHEATGGTPFLVRQLVAALSEGGVEPNAAAAARVESLGARTVSRWILVRLGSLPSPAGDMARAVAVLEQADLAHAAALAGLTEEQAARAADALVAAGILNDGRPLAFVHPVVRAGVYAEIPMSDRAEGHRHAARLLAAQDAAPERMAQHLMLVEPAGDSWVVDRLAEAASAAAARGASDSAINYLKRALREPAHILRRGQLLLDLGLVTGRIDQTEALTHLEASVAAATDDELRCAAARMMATALLQAQRSPEAVELVDRVAAQIDPAREDLRLLLEVTAVTGGFVDERTGPLIRDRMTVLLERAQTEAEPSRDLLALAALVSLGKNDGAEVSAGLALRALAAGDGPAPGPTEVPWFSSATITLVWAEHYDEARLALDAAARVARATGDGWLLSIALSHRAWLEHRRGDLTAAEADARATLATSSLTAPPLYRLMAGGSLAGTLVHLGRLDEAERLLEPLEEESRGHTSLAAVLRSGRGLLRTAQRRPEEAIADLLSVGETFHKIGIECPGVLPWRSEAAWAYLQMGRREEAERLGRAELARARVFGAPRALGLAAHATGVAAGGDEGEQLVREAVASLDTAGVATERARAQSDLGAMLRRAGRRAEARDHLRAALDTASRIGAVAVADQAEIELRATGAKPRRVVLTGLEALTASERRVAELASQGLTNRDIAQTLFVTARTVEGHLTNVFRKLDVDSREHLPDALAGPLRETA